MNTKGYFCILFLICIFTKSLKADDLQKQNITDKNASETVHYDIRSNNDNDHENYNNEHHDNTHIDQHSEANNHHLDEHNQANEEHYNSEHGNDDGHKHKPDHHYPDGKKKRFTYNVADISPDDFYPMIKQFKKLILYFYSKSNPFTDDFSEIMEEVANQSIKEKLDYKFAKVDAIAHEEFAHSFNVIETPTVFYVYINGEDVIKQVYQGYKSKKAMFNYLKKKISYVPKQFTDYSKFLKLVSKAKKFLLFLGDKEKHPTLLDKIVQVSLDMGIHNIFWSKSNEFYNKYGIKHDKLEIIYHEVNNGVVDQGTPFEVSTNPVEFTETNLISLFRTYIYPNFLEYHTSNLKKVYSAQGKTSLSLGIFIYDEKDVEVNTEGKHNHGEIAELASGYARKHRRDLIYFFSHGTNKNYPQLLHSFGLDINKSSLPAFVIFEAVSEEKPHSVQKRYLLGAINNKLKEEDIEKFIHDFKDKKLEPYIVSEPIPENPVDGFGIYKMVGRTYRDTITKVGKGKHVLVYLYTENERCRIFDGILQRVIKKVNEGNNILFAKIDIYKNEYDGIESVATPTLVLFTDTDEENKIVNGKVHSGYYDTKGIIKFLRVNFKEIGKSLKVAEFEDDEELDEKERYNPVLPKEDNLQVAEDNERNKEGYYHPDGVEGENPKYYIHTDEQDLHMLQGHTDDYEENKYLNKNFEKKHGKVDL